MKAGPDIAVVASLVGDPARANMLTALMTGRALTASELAQQAGITPQTASSHLAKLEITVMFEELMARVPNMELDGPVARLRSNFINGIKHMPVGYG